MAVGISSVLVQEQGEWFVDYSVHNGGDYPIDNVVMVVPRFLYDWHLAEQVVPSIAAKGTLPSERVRLHVDPDFDPGFNELTDTAWLRFTDVWGNHWARRPGELERHERPARRC